MNAATLLAIFIVPVLYFVIESFAERGKPSPVKPLSANKPVAVEGD